MLLRRLSNVGAFIPSGIDSSGRGSGMICSGDDVYQKVLKICNFIKKFVQDCSLQCHQTQNVCDADHDIGVLFTWTIILSMCKKRLLRSVNQAAKLQVGGGEESPPN